MLMSIRRFENEEMKNDITFVVPIVNNKGPKKPVLPKHESVRNIYFHYISWHCKTY